MVEVSGNSRSDEQTSAQISQLSRQRALNGDATLSAETLRAVQQGAVAPTVSTPAEQNVSPASNSADLQNATPTDQVRTASTVELSPEVEGVTTTAAERLNEARPAQASEFGPAAILDLSPAAQEAIANIIEQRQAAPTAEIEGSVADVEEAEDIANSRPATGSDPITQIGVQNEINQAEREQFFQDVQPLEPQEPTLNRPDPAAVELARNFENTEIDDAEFAQQVTTENLVASNAFFEELSQGTFEASQQQSQQLVQAFNTGTFEEQTRQEGLFATAENQNNFVQNEIQQNAQSASTQQSQEIEASNTDSAQNRVEFEDAFEFANTPIVGPEDTSEAEAQASDINQVVNVDANNQSNEDILESQNALQSLRTPGTSDVPESDRLALQI